MSQVKFAYHESAHAIVAHRLGREVEQVTLHPAGGLVREQQFAPGGSEQEIAESLVVTFAGPAGEKYAPTAANAASRNGGEQPGDLTVEQLEAMFRSEELGTTTPSDEQTIAHYSERVGPEVVAKAKDLAEELVMRAAVVGHLERIADELLWRGSLTGDDLRMLLDAPA